MVTESMDGTKIGRKMAEKAPSAGESKKQHDFEMVLVVKPEADEEKFNTILNNIKQLITGLGGTVSDVEQWGKRKLAYPIKGISEGSYVLTRFKLEPSQNKELEAKLKISEEIARHLLIKVE